MEMDITLPLCSVTRSYAGPPGAEKTKKDYPPGRLRGSMALPHVGFSAPNSSLTVISPSVFILPGQEYPAAAALGILPRLLPQQAG